MKVTSALIVALGFVERNSTVEGHGPDAREIVKTNTDGESIIIQGSVDEVVATCLANNVDVPYFVELLMSFAAEIADRLARKEVTDRFTSFIALAALASGIGAVAPKASV